MAQPRVGARVRFWIAAPVAAAALFFVPLPAGFVDRWYSQGIYPWIQSGLTAVTNHVPGAAIDWMIGIAAVIVVLRIVQFILRAITVSGCASP